MRRNEIVRRVLGVSLALLLGGLAVLLCAYALLPSILPHVTVSERTYDLNPMLPEGIRELFTNRTATVRIDFARSRHCDVVARASGRILDWPYELQSEISYSLFSRRAKAVCDFRLVRTLWQAQCRASYASKEGWAAEFSVPATTFDDQDAVLGSILSRLPKGSVSNVTFSGSVSLQASAFTTNGSPLAVWQGSARLANLSASMVAGGSPVSISRLSFRAGASGLGRHVDLGPLMPRAQAIDVSGVAISNVFATIRATEKAFLVTEASADVFGGNAHLYALHLNPERLNAGVTIFLDNIETGLVFQRLKGFQGRASGRLQGKMPLRLTRGAKLAFGDSFLYSIPGETGIIQMDDPSPVIENLSMSGVSKDACANLDKALRNLAYTALNLNLKRAEDGSHALGFKLEGSATKGKTTVPVSFDVTLRGDIEQLVNLGLKAKGK